MRRNELLLIQLGEECNEVAHRVSKSLRFGLSEKLVGQPYTNAELIMREFTDLVCLFEMLVEANVLIDLDEAALDAALLAKKEKVNKYLAYSKVCGTLED